jgi:hypothetical protein
MIPPCLLCGHEMVVNDNSNVWFDLYCNQHSSPDSSIDNAYQRAHYFRQSKDPNSEIINYSFNIVIDNKMYGLDSYKYIPQTIVMAVVNGFGKNLMTISTFTPLPKTKESLEYIIRRILNLKAFL